MRAPSRLPDPPPPIYTWDIVGEGGSEAGVTRDHDRARDAVEAALHRAPEGCMAVVRRVELPPSGRSIYIPVGNAALAWLTGEGDAVLWAE
ncbi:hypothetical protein [Actinomadura gamaensis]|uniref:Uncharacterized protein n=1 Tax=Actinomadura gamaensis TaxID=1763541 RepID=A0ABV9TXG9_9ACTN